MWNVNKDDELKRNCTKSKNKKINNRIAIAVWYYFIKHNIYYNEQTYQHLPRCFLQYYIIIYTYSKFILFNTMINDNIQIYILVHTLLYETPRTRRGDELMFFYSPVYTGFRVDIIINI